MLNQFTVDRFIKVGLSVVLVGLLAACASGSKTPKPADLGANPGLLGIRTAWKSQIGKIPSF